MSWLLHLIHKDLITQFIQMLNAWYLLLWRVLLSIETLKEEDKSGRPGRAAETVDEHFLSLTVDEVIQDEASLKHLIRHLVNRIAVRNRKRHIIQISLLAQHLLKIVG